MRYLLRASVCALSVLFCLQPGALSAAELAIQHSFRTNDAYGVPQRIAMDRDGAIYGVLNHTQIIRLSPPASDKAARIQTKLHAEPEGVNPGLTIGPDGAIYGTTPGQSADDNGSVFMLSPPRPGTNEWTKTELYRFRGLGDGAYPFATLLVRGRNIYGMTSASGTANCQGCKPGVIFRLLRSADGDDWRFTVIHRFASYNEMPPTDDPLAIDDDGKLYATSLNDGVACSNGNGCGTVYQLTPPVSPAAGPLWTKRVIHAFKGGFSGFNPGANVVVDRNGSLYGSASYEPSCDPYNYCRVIFRLTRTKTNPSAWAIEYLYRFKSPSEGGLYVEVPLIIDGTGAIYGIAGPKAVLLSPCNSQGVNSCGAIFKLSPPDSPSQRWTKSELYKFSESLGFPSPLALAPGRALYGTTLTGGRLDGGALFKLTQ